MQSLNLLFNSVISNLILKFSPTRFDFNISFCRFYFIQSSLLQLSNDFYLIPFSLLQLLNNLYLFRNYSSHWRELFQPLVRTIPAVARTIPATGENYSSHWWELFQPWRELFQPLVRTIPAVVRSIPAVARTIPAVGRTIPAVARTIPATGENYSSRGENYSSHWWELFQPLMRTIPTLVQSIQMWLCYLNTEAARGCARACACIVRAVARIVCTSLYIIKIN